MSLLQIHLTGTQLQKNTHRCHNVLFGHASFISTLQFSVVQTPRYRSHHKCTKRGFFTSCPPFLYRKRHLVIPPGDLERRSVFWYLPWNFFRLFTCRYRLKPLRWKRVVCASPPRDFHCLPLRLSAPEV